MDSSLSDVSAEVAAVRRTYWPRSQMFRLQLSRDMLATILINGPAVPAEPKVFMGMKVHVADWMPGQSFLILDDHGDPVGGRNLAHNASEMSDDVTIPTNTNRLTP